MNAAESGLRRTVVACLVIGFVAAATWWPRAEGPIDLRWDGGAYYILGTSLAKGEGYRLLSEPGNSESSLHPPFLPALVATYQTLLQTSDPVRVGHVLRLTVALFSVAYGIAIFVLLSAYIPRTYALAAALIAVLQPQYAYFSDSLYAETFFALFTVLFFILQRYRANTACFLLSGLCAVLAYEARTAGIALLAAWVAESLLRRDYRRAAIAFAIAVVPIVSWMGWIKAVESSPEYRQPAYAYQRAPYVYFNVSYARNLMVLADPSTPELGPLTTSVLLDRVWSNVKALPVSIGQAVSGWEAQAWVALPLAFLVLIGMILQARRKQYLMLMYVALSLAAVCLTPFQKQFVRYLMPLYPFFALALFQLLAKLAQEPGFSTRLLPGYARVIPVCIVVSVIAYQEFHDLRKLYGLNHHDAAYEHRGQLVKYKLFYYAPVGTAFDQALDWLQPRAELADVIAATDPQWVYLRTGRKAVLPPFESDGKRAQQLIDTVPVKYLIVETKPERLGLGAYHRFTSALLRENPGQWTRIWSSDDRTVEIFRRERGLRPREGSD